MIHHDDKQGSDGWRRARAGVVTASRFNDVLTPKDLRPAKGDAYLNTLLAEWLLGGPIDETAPSGYVTRGVVTEAEGRAWYAFTRGEVREVGFITRDDGRVGASPDGLVGDDGGLEMKVPAPHTHVGYLRDPASLVAAYRGQVQGGLLVTGRKWWDIVSYHPTIPSVVVRVEPDAEYLAALEPALTAFLARLDAAKAALAEARESIASNPFTAAAFDDVRAATRR